jgi:site-specific DNA recombinase
MTDSPEIVDIYVRTSDEEVTADGKQFGVENQERELRAYAEERGWQVGEVYVEHSVSASRSGVVRPEFERLLERTEKRPVVAWDWERFIRVSKDVERVIEQKFLVYFKHVGAIDLSTDSGEMLARVLTAMATNEIKTKRRRALMANRARAEDGWPLWKQPPFGHTIKGEIVEDQAKLIRDAAARFLDGDSLYSIAKDWNDAGVPTRHGRGWTPKTLRTMLLHPRMNGENSYEGVRTEKSRVQRILDADTYAALRHKFNSRKGTSGTKGRVGTLLTGIAVCGVCNEAKVHASAAKGKAAYRCATGAHNRHWREETDEYVIGYLLALFTSGTLVSGVADESEKVRLTNRSNELNAELDDWYSQAREFGADRLSKIVKPIEKEIESIAERLEAIHSEDLFSEFVAVDGIPRFSDQSKARAKWDSLPLLRQREIIQGAVEVRLLQRTNRDRGFNPERVEVVPARSLNFGIYAPK